MRTPMKTWLVSEHADPLQALGGTDAGGQNVHVAALAAGLARRGHEVTVFTRRWGLEAPEIESRDGYTVERLRAGPPVALDKDELLPHMVEFGDRLRARLLQSPPDLVHAHFWMSGLASLRAVEGTVTPLVQTFHALGSVKRREQGAADTSPDTRVPLERQLCQRVDHVIATCRDEVAELALLGLPAHRVSVVPCGVDPTRFRPAPASEDIGELRVLNVGRIVPRKGVDDVIRAVALVCSARLVIAGGPEPHLLGTDPEIERLRGIAREYGVEDRVSFTGAVDHARVPELIRASHVVATAPWYEPFGITPLEAMSCGRPVVGTAVGGLLDTVVAPVGELVPPHDPVALAESLLRVGGDPERRRLAAEQGPTRVAEHYTWDAVVAATEAAYRRIVDMSATTPLLPPQPPFHASHREVLR